MEVSMQDRHGSWAYPSGQALRKPESPLHCGDPPHDKASLVEYGGGVPKVPAGTSWGHLVWGRGSKGTLSAQGKWKMRCQSGFSSTSVPLADPPASCHPVPSPAEHGLSSLCPHCQGKAMSRGWLLRSTQRQGGLWEAGGEGLCLHIPCPSPLSSGSHPHSIPGAGEKPCFPSASPACRHVLPIRP